MPYVAVWEEGMEPNAGRKRELNSNCFIARGSDKTEKNAKWKSQPRPHKRGTL